MPKFKIQITFLIFIILMAIDCFGNAVVHDFIVLSWQEIQGNELEIKIIDSGDIEKVIHIRFNPDRVTSLIHEKDKRASADQQYNEAFFIAQKTANSI